jgi:hypothetical protein
MMNDHGQALIETATFFLALSVLLGGLCGFTKWMAVREKLLLAANEGALLYSSGHWERGEVEARMRQFLAAGSPPLNPDGIHVSVGPAASMKAWTFELDESIAEYAPPGGWHYLLGADPKMTEKCVIKHAPHYWAPIQPWGGPAVAYES